MGLPKEASESDIVGLAKAYMRAEHSSVLDSAEVLALEAEGWVLNLARKGVIPRAFIGLREDGAKFAVDLRGSGLNHRNNRQFLSWLTSELPLTAYSYVTHIGKVNDTSRPEEITEGVEVYASSHHVDAATSLDIVGRSDTGALSYSEPHRQHNSHEGE